MKTIQILEGKINTRSGDFDHVFSFSDNPADSFPHHYITQAEVNLIYNETYNGVCHTLKHHPFQADFTYQGVDLLWCYKKELFRHLYVINLRYQTLKRVVKQNLDSRFYLQKCNQNSEKPELANVIGSSPLAKQFKFNVQPAGRESIQTPTFPPKKKPFWPSILSWGNVKTCRAGIFSDFERSKNVLAHLKNKKPILFFNYPSPRIFLKAIVGGVPFFQITLHSKAENDYREKANFFVNLLKEKRVFQNFMIDDLSCEELLAEKLIVLFRSALPQLLFEIDSMRLFFAQAKALRSVLLDEDIDASKNAFCQLARQFGVVTFVELHGVLGDKHGFVPLTADKILVWGNVQKRKLISWGCPSEQIIVSGCSRYNEYQKMDAKQIKKKVAEQLGFHANEKIVLVAFTPISKRWHVLFERQMWEVISETLEVISKLADHARFIIKLHPADENAGYYQSWIKNHRLDHRIVLVRQCDPLLLAKAADFLIVYRSTYSVDGFALDKPVICLDDGCDSLNEYRPFSIFYYSKDKETLEYHCQSLLNQPSVKLDRWDEAKVECLNQGISADQFIADLLSSVPNGRSE